MNRVLETAAFTVAGLIAGLSLAAWWESEPAEPVGATGAARELARRVAALETALLEERRRRGGLESDLAALRGRLDGGSASAGDGASAARAAPRETAAEGRAAVEDAAPAPDPRERRPRFAEVDPERRRVDRLVEAGFSPDRAAWIGQRVSDLRLEALEAQYAAARGLETPAARRSVSQALRAELGDADYERYLEAMDRSTSVAVRRVLARSPAQQAGLQPGDAVVAYGGERVFEMGDLNRLILEGRPGEPVVVDALREGQRIQLYVPRGPLGITGGGRFRGRAP